MGYDSENRSKMHFCIAGTSPSSTNRLVPAPQISINPEIYYSNDTVIGYTYNITLNGYANALRRDQGDGARASGIMSSGIEQTFSHINDIREIFKGNGGNLYLYDTGGSLVLQGKGATIKSIKFDESENRWFNYSPYTIELEFNEIDFLGCNNNAVIPCAGSFFHTDQSKVTTSDNLVDFKKYKLKNFNDKWTISLNNELNTQYYFNVTYTISATGKHYYNSSGQLIPAWQQAKKFVQERLRQQVEALIDGAVALSNSSSEDGCNASFAAEDLYQRNADNTIFDGFDKGGDKKYIIYNETINCNTSESAGSFSVTYNAIISAYDQGIGTESENGSIHTYTRNKSISQPTNKITTTVSVQGTVQGLVKGGFIDDPNGFELPMNGRFISATTVGQSKYDNAYAYYLSNIGGPSDLNETFKNYTDVDSVRQCAGATGRIPPASFTLDHNYHEGSVSYSAQYDSDHDSEQHMTVTITEGDPTPMFNEFVIPFRSEGPLIQLLGCSNPRTLSINIEGSDPSNKNCNPSSIPNNTPYVGTILDEIGAAAGGGWIQTGAQYTNNLTDGSFSINLEYVNPN